MTYTRWTDYKPIFVILAVVAFLIPVGYAACSELTKTKDQRFEVKTIEEGVYLIVDRQTKKAYLTSRNGGIIEVPLGDK